MKVYLVQLTLYINGKPFEINYMESSNEYHPEVFVEMDGDDDADYGKIKTGIPKWANFIGSSLKSRQFKFKKRIKKVVNDRKTNFYPEAHARDTHSIVEILLIYIQLRPKENKDKFLKPSCGGTATRVGIRHLVVPHTGAKLHRRRSSSSIASAARRNTAEHSGSSPRSAKSNSSSSLIDKSTSLLLPSLSSTMLSSMVDDMDSDSENHLNSNVLTRDSSPRSKTVGLFSSSEFDTVVAEIAVVSTSAAVAAAVSWPLRLWWLFLDAGGRWLWSDE